MGDVVVFKDLDEVKKKAEQVNEELNLKKACKGLVEVFLNYFEAQERLKEAKEEVKVRAKYGGLIGEQVKVLIELCKLRAKSEYEVMGGDLVQRKLFDLEKERKWAEELLKYIPAFKR